MKFRITSNGLWFRIEGQSKDFFGTGPWQPVTAYECFENLPKKFTTFEEAKKVFDFLEAGGDPYDFKVVLE